MAHSRCVGPKDKNALKKYPNHCIIGSMKREKTRLWIMAALLVAAMLLTACGAGGSEGSGTGAAGSAASEVSAEGAGGESAGSAAAPSCGDTVSAAQAMEMDADTVIIPEEDLDPYFAIREIDDTVYQRIVGKSFSEDGEISRDDLRYLRVLHVGFDGQTRIGEMIVNKAAAEDVLAVFRELYEKRYQIRKMVLVDQYYDIHMEKYEALDRGNQADCVSIEDDNTSAFNYRVASNNSEVLSNHGRGFAIDLNPYENPYVNADGSLDGPDGSAEYMDRSKATEENHMLKDGDTAVSAFKAHGFSWGGDWEGDKDYQHFDYEQQK